MCHAGVAETYCFLAMNYWRTKNIKIDKYNEINLIAPCIVSYVLPFMFKLISIHPKHTASTHPQETCPRIHYWENRREKSDDIQTHHPSWSWMACFQTTVLQSLPHIKGRWHSGPVTKSLKILLMKKNKTIDSQGAMIKPKFDQPCKEWISRFEILSLHLNNRSNR